VYLIYDSPRMQHCGWHPGAAVQRLPGARVDAQLLQSAASKQRTRDKSTASKSVLIMQLESAQKHMAAQQRQEKQVAKMHRRLAKSLEKMNAPRPPSLKHRAEKMLVRLVTRSSHPPIDATGVPGMPVRGKGRRTSMDIRPGQLAMYADEGAQGARSKGGGGGKGRGGGKRKGRGTASGSGGGAQAGAREPST
jgi:hypothetical protein